MLYLQHDVDAALAKYKTVACGDRSFCLTLNMFCYVMQLHDSIKAESIILHIAVVQKHL